MYDLEKIREERRKWENDFYALHQYQTQGMELEKLGDIEGAITEYNHAVDFGEMSARMRINNYLHSIERLAILYRKQKDYDNEIRVLNIALQYKDLHKSKEARLQDRLTKALVLKQKS